MMKTLYPILKYGLAIASCLLAVGCSNSLVVEGQFPGPMIDKLPLTLGVHYEDEFRQYVYEEKSDDRTKWTIDSGQAQTQLFNTVLPKMFEKVVMVDAIPGLPMAEETSVDTDTADDASESQESPPEAEDGAAQPEAANPEEVDSAASDDDKPWDEVPLATTEPQASGPEADQADNQSEVPVTQDTDHKTQPPAAPASNIDYSQFDLLLSPRVDEFQYSMPRETKVNVFEIWIKYNMRVYSNDGQLIADWIMSAYGKTPTAFMKSKEEALNEAVIMALRDIGASLSLGFSRVPEIRAWLEQHNKSMISSSETPPA